MNLTAFIAVFIGGGIGSILRYSISLLILRSSTSAFPWATLTANILSCALMAIALFYFADRIPEGSWQRLFILVGICGGFSTFSTFSLENFQLFKDGSYLFLGMNIIISVLLCFGIFWTLYKRIA